PLWIALPCRRFRRNGRYAPELRGTIAKSGDKSPHCKEGHMKYMLLVYLDEQALSDSEREHCYVESAQLAHDLSEKGKYISAGPLHPVATATSVRVRNSKRLVTDGPFAETREQLGGYYLIDAKD